MRDFRLAFIHVPKTAGSAFVGKIINLWPKTLISPWPGQPGFMIAGREHCQRYYFTAGHVFYVKMKELLHPDMNWFVMLRDPIERVYSHYNHLVKFKYTDATSFENFIYESKNKPLAHNLMAKYIGWWPEDFVGIPEHTATIEHWPMKISDEELYDRAMSALDSFWYVGIQDTGWVQAVKKVYDNMGRNIPPNTVQLPPRNYKANMSSQVIADLEEFNQVDIRIYNEYRNRY